MLWYEIKMFNIIQAVDQIYEKKGVKKRIKGNKLTAEGWKDESNIKRQTREQMDSSCDNGQLLSFTR